MHKHLRSAFTLIEVMIVVAIIALLSVLAFTTWKNQLAKSKDALRKQDLQRIRTAFEEYFNDNGCYPEGDILTHCGGNQLAPYLAQIPCDPVYSTPYCYLADTDYPSCGKKYRLLATLGNQADPNIKELGCDGDAFCGWETECNQVAGRSGYNFGYSSLNILLANPNMPTPSPSLSPSPTPPPGNYACDPQGICNYYSDPNSANCPITFADSQCNNSCSNPANRCSQ